MQRTSFYPLRGGLNLITSAIETPPGHVIAAQNYEVVERGYRRMDGYERFDGHPKPSAASYWYLPFMDDVAGFSVGDVVTGATSSATGTVIVVSQGGGGVVAFGVFAEGVTETGTGDPNFLVLTGVTGTFVDAEHIQVSASTVADVDGTATERGAPSAEEDRYWLQIAIEHARLAIAAPTGSGPARGGFVYKGDCYCVRDNAGATAAVLYKQTTSGWSAQNIGREVAFTSGGTYQILAGNTITGATSGATAVITRVVLASGTWAGGDAAGYLIFTSQTGTFQAENLNVGANLNVATIAANSTGYSLPAGGRYEFVIHNFFGSSALERVYGCNGVGRAFEFDGSVFVTIRTGLSDLLDKPTHIAAYHQHLMLAFRGGSLQGSSTGDPYTWSALTGASEIGIGEDITGLMANVADSLIVWGKRKIKYLNGTSPADFSLQDISEDSGAAEWTTQQMGSPMYLDQRGVRTLETTQAYGNFNRGTISRRVEPLVRRNLASGRASSGSIRCRAKDQYRLYWDDYTGLSIYVGRQEAEILPFKMGHQVACTWSGEDSLGREIMFFGASTGFVYQIDAGTSFDGAEVEAFMRLPFNHVGSPTQKKRWHKATLEVDAEVGSRIAMTAEFSYADPDQPSMQEYAVQPKRDGWIFDVATWPFHWTATDAGALEATGSGGIWAEHNYGEFFWSAPIEGLVEAPIDGIGQNISIAVFGSGTYAEPHTAHGLTLHYTYRGLKR
jgi:hypothetical protein